MAQALVRHDELIAATVEAGGGRFIKSMGEGDATVSVFVDPAKALAAVLEMNRRLGAEEWPDGLQLRVRTALHTGEAERRDETYFGPALNVAARIRGLGDGGEVLLSRVTGDLVRGRMPDGASLVDLGPHRLRGVRETEHLFAVSAPGISTPSRRPNVHIPACSRSSGMIASCSSDGRTWPTSCSAAFAIAASSRSSAAPEAGSRPCFGRGCCPRSARARS